MDAARLNHLPNLSVYTSDSFGSHFSDPIIPWFSGFSGFSSPMYIMDPGSGFSQLLLLMSAQHVIDISVFGT